MQKGVIFMATKKADVTPEENDKNFDAFFADALASKELAAVEPEYNAPNKEEPVKEESAKEEPVKEEPVKEESAKEEPVKEESAKEEPVKEEPVKEEPVKEDPKIAELMDKIAALEKQVATPPKEEPKGPTAAEIAEVEEVKKKTEAFSKKFEEDWPDHAAMFNMQRKTLIDEVTVVLSKVLTPVMEKLTATEGAVAETAQEKMMNSILSVHEDAVALIPDVEKWISTLPKYQQKAANEVLDSGNVKDIIEIYDTFKTQTGRVKTEPIPDPKAQEIEAEKQRKLKSLESPKASRTGVATEVDPTDFNGAFEEALKVV
jgi:hypothetical protein